MTCIDRSTPSNRVSRPTTLTLAVVLISLMGSVAAEATPLRWQLKDVWFEDGSRATGHFNYDADTNIFSSVFVTTSLGAVYRDLSLFGGSQSDVSLLGRSRDGTSVVLFAFFEEAMTHAGGTIGIVPGSIYTVPSFSVEGECSPLNGNPCGLVQYVRGISSGSIVAVPEPGLAGLLGLAIFEWVRRRRA